MPIAKAVGQVLVTGASQGIGKAIAVELATRKSFVLGVCRTKPEELLESGRFQYSDYVSWKPLDLSDATAVEQFVASVGSMPIRALILCAVNYGAGGRHPTETTSAQEWQQVIATNCIGQCLLVSRLLPKLVANGPGVIVNISSEVAVLPAAGRAAYGASKAGLHAMLRAVRAEHPAQELLVYQLIPTFQLATNGLRRRRPVDFDFSSYADPSVLARIIPELLCPSGVRLGPGSYLVRRDGTLNPYIEVTHL